MFVMPSRFEPCGLSQMYSLKYGTPPVVRVTGGLADTIVDTTEETLAAGTANGFTFHEPTPQALSAALKRADRLSGPSRRLAAAARQRHERRLVVDPQRQAIRRPLRCNRCPHAARHDRPASGSVTHRMALP